MATQPLQSPEIAVARAVKSALDSLDDVEKDKNFWGFVKGWPSMMVRDGMLQTLSFILSKAKDSEEGKKYQELFNAINNYSREILQLNENDSRNIIEYMIEESLALEKYLYIENQLLNYVIWFKRIGLALKADPSVR